MSKNEYLNEKPPFGVAFRLLPPVFLLWWAHSVLAIIAHLAERIYLVQVTVFVAQWDIEKFLQGESVALETPELGIGFTADVTEIEFTTIMQGSRRMGVRWISYRP